MAGRGRPKSKDATQHECAKHLDLSITSLRNLVATDVVPKPGGDVTVDDVRVAYLRHLRGRAARWVTDDPKTLNLQAERARVAAAQAEKIERELARDAGDTVSVQEQLELTAVLDTAMRTRLQALGVRMCQQLATESDPEAVCEILNEAVHAALQGAVSGVPNSNDEAAA